MKEKMKSIRINLQRLLEPFGDMLFEYKTLLANETFNMELKQKTHLFYQKLKPEAEKIQKVELNAERGKLPLVLSIVALLASIGTIIRAFVK